MLKDNLIEVEEHIKKACEKSGRNPEDVCCCSKQDQAQGYAYGSI